MLSVDPYMTINNVPTQSVLSPLLQELESLGISIKHTVSDLNDDKELEFLKEIKEMEGKGIFVNPGGG